ncbi:hypothetical protein FQN54_004263 [Arachnomyces sp. PD_36]|nr:hypothetical protein FQN54_004263 [Arachnomyces sp. PD_36]
MAEPSDAHLSSECEEEVYEEAEEGEEEDEEEEEVDESVLEDMRKLEESFEGISEKYRMINRIGEGTFSTVYKAEDLQYDQYVNDWDLDRDSDDRDNLPPSKKRRVGDPRAPEARASKPKRKPRYVALKKIYVTSSPLRIHNELDILHDLQGCKSVCPLITAFRHLDQVVAVLPYFPHTDFRLQYRCFRVSDIRDYFRSLLTALSAVHKEGIIHRDIKPTNFLYDPDRREGVLVDFGLAEREGYEYCGHCACEDSPSVRRTRVLSHPQATSNTLSTGYPKNDSRPSRRANRAGTRGFRAPEVLFKCTAQTTKIDMWSAGVILLTILGRRFPFFNSSDDVDAMIEMASVFGIRRMKAAALLHGQIFETSLPSIGEKGYGWEKLVHWSSCEAELTDSIRQATQFLSGLMELDPAKRLSAKEALRHEFFTHPVEDEIYEEEDGRASEEEVDSVEERVSDAGREEDEIQMDRDLILSDLSRGAGSDDIVHPMSSWVDRAHYCPSSPYVDSPQTIGFSATISAPHMHAHACEYLLPYLHAGSNVLDIGSGSGYLTHVFANLVTESPSDPSSEPGHVVGIDHIQGLVDLSRNNMNKSEVGRKLLETGKVKLITGDGRLGFPEGAPYDVIHVGAAAETMHPALIEQLRAPGRMFIPVESGGEDGVRFHSLGLGGGQYIWVVDKLADGSVKKEKIFGVSYVPLTDAPKK